MVRHQIMAPGTLLTPSLKTWSVRSCTEYSSRPGQPALPFNPNGMPNAQRCAYAGQWLKSGPRVLFSHMSSASCLGALDTLPRNQQHYNTC